MPLSAPVHRLKRRAKLLARTEKIPLHAALDRVAAEQGFSTWSLLSARSVPPSPSRDLLDRLIPGDMLLLGARPGHGKTRLGLQLLVDAARDGRRAAFFTLDYSEREAAERLRALGGGRTAAGTVEVVASDDVCADSVARHLAGSPRGTVAVIDYLQILDQRRSTPPLADQVRALGDLARSSGLVLGFISQIDRSFDPERDRLPGLRHLRLPNPVDVGAFSKACFLHDGEVALQDVA